MRKYGWRPLLLALVGTGFVTLTSAPAQNDAAIQRTNQHERDVEPVGPIVVGSDEYLERARFDRTRGMGTIQVIPIDIRLVDDHSACVDLAFRGNPSSVASLRHALTKSIRAHPNSYFKLQAIQESCGEDCPRTIVLFGLREAVNAFMHVHDGQPYEDDLIEIEGAVEGVNSYMLYPDAPIGVGDRIRVKIREEPAPFRDTKEMQARRERFGFDARAQVYSMHFTWSFESGAPRRDLLDFKPIHEWVEVQVR